MRIGIGNTIPERVSLPGQSGGGVVIPDEFIFEVNAAIGNIIDLTTRNNGAAADFIINWGEGADETVNAATASHTYASSGTKVVKINKAGTNTPVNDFNVLATNEGRSIVTKISNWGATEWYSLRDGFNLCTNLTIVDSATQLLTASNASNLFYNTFRDCTSLTVADMSNWATNNIVWYLRGTFNGCTNVNLVKAPSSRKMPLSLFGTTASQQFNNSAFRLVGSATANGATFEFGGLDFSDTSLVNISTCFANAKINGNTSDFSDWVFPSTVASIGNLFYFAQVVGTDPTLNCSGWTTLQANSFAGTFRGLNSATTPNNLTLNVSNWNVSNTNYFGLFMGHTSSANRIANIIGLSTWGATPGGVNIAFFFANMAYLKLTSDDNFSDAFINSLTPTDVSSSFYNVGGSLSSGDFGEPPNLASLDLSNSSTLSGLFKSSHFSSLPDFTNVTFPTLPVNWSSFFFNASTDSVVPHLDLSNITFKPTSLTRSFEAFRSANKITFPSGSNSDLSSLTSMFYTFNSAGNASNELEVILPTDADYSSVTSWVNAFNGLNGPGTDTLTTCVGDTLIRRLNATSLNTNQQALNLYNTKLTGSPSVVDSNVTDLETAGWTITSNATDAVMPFVYTTPLTTGISATPTGSFTGGTFSSSNSNIAVNATTGEINTPNAGNTTIRYTLADGCYNEQALVVNLALAQVNNVYSMSFDGINDVVRVDETQLTGNSSVSLWFKTSAVTSSSNIDQLLGGGIGVGTTNAGYFQYLSISSNKIVNYGGTGIGYFELASTAVNDGAWHNLILTYDPTTAGGVYGRGTLKAYLDGTLTSTTDTNGYAINWTSSTLRTIGNYGTTNTNRPFDGTIDEVAAWNVILTPDQVLSIYNATEVVAGVSKTADLSQLTTPPVKWYRMGD